MSITLDNRRLLALEWAQLILLSLVHFWADLYMGMGVPLIPRIRADFGLTIFAGVTLITVPSLAVNLVQVLVGHTRANQTFPLLIVIGGIIAVASSALGLLPHQTWAYSLVMMLFIITAIGVGLLHPESFRAVHALQRISPALTTALFMIGGQLGYGLGGWIATGLVKWTGYAGLWLLLPVMVLLVALVVILRIKLAVDKPAGHAPEPTINNRPQLSFWPVWFMALPTAATISIFVGLLPQRLNELGFSLQFGGYCNTLFMIGSVAGCLFWSAISHRLHPIKCATISIIVGTPFIPLYACLMKHQSASLLLLGSGFFLMSIFMLIVQEARYCRGLNLGARMALATGGAWGFSNLVFMLSSYVIGKYWSEQAFIYVGIHWSWVVCLPSIVLGFYIIGKLKTNCRMGCAHAD